MNNRELQQELRLRNKFVFGRTKADLIQCLRSTLCGAQRVPSLLLMNPTQSLMTSNLKEYTVLDCEPLHDLKGHIQNVFDELPAILTKPLQSEVKMLIETDLGKDMKTGGDYRLAAVHLLTLLRKRNVPKILQLVETLVHISQILYANEGERSMKLVLRLYNLTWVHFELCCELFHTTKKVSHQKMFGIYLHALTLHAPLQYEILCLKSANTENEERLFGQAKNMVHSATNRQPTTVIPNILLRLQARQKKGNLYKEYYNASNRISKEVQQMGGETQNTFIQVSFLSTRMSSWQAHLQRLSPFLTRGEGVWWQCRDDGYMFMDGDKEPETRLQGPLLHHFRDTTLQQVYDEKEIAWAHIVEESIKVPSPFIKLYNTNGECIGRQVFKTEQENETEEWNEPQERGEKTHGSVEEDRQEKELENQESEGEVCMEENEDAERKGENEDVKDHEYQVEIINDEVETELREENLKTKLCKALWKALGQMSSDLVSLDSLRYEIKHCNECVSHGNVAKHKQLVNDFKKQLLRKQEELKKSVKDFENRYFTKYHHLPNQTTEENYNALLKSQRFVAKLISSQDFIL